MFILGSNLEHVRSHFGWTIFDSIFASSGDRCRPKYMHTVASADEPALVAGISLEIQVLRKWGDDDDDVTPTVFYEGDPEWVLPGRLAPFQCFVRQLYEWRSFQPSADHPRCLTLSQRVQGLPRYALEDERCPVLALKFHLESHGWGLVNALVTHEDSKHETSPGESAYVEIPFWCPKAKRPGRRRT